MNLAEWHFERGLMHVKMTGEVLRARGQEVCAGDGWTGIERLAVEGIDAPMLKTLLADPRFVLPPFLELVGQPGCVLGNEGLGTLARSPMLREVRQLSVIGQHITPAGVQALANSSYAENLVSLSLASRGEMVNRIGVRGLQSLLRSRALQSVRTLDLSGNRLRCYGAKMLAGSPRLADLGVLLLADNDIENPGIAALADSPFVAGLQYLDLRDNPFSVA